MRRRKFQVSFVLAALWVLAGLVAGQQPVATVKEGNAGTQQSEEDSVDRDYSSQLPRIPPVEPQNALELFVTAPGFHVELAAAEPLVVDPVAACFDEDGRLYVIEMRDYSEDDQLRLGRVRLLEDRDDDGRFDSSTVFADDLSWPTAVFCYAGGVFVGAAPDILYLKDTDGDGRADERRVVFTGFGRSNVQGLLNSFQWGLDNRIHGATSSAGAQLRRADEPEGEPLVLRGRDFAFDPRTLTIEATTGGGQHGMSFNRWGDRFVCSNSDHVQLIFYEDRYAARNPYVTPPPARRSIAVDGPQADVFRASPVEPWRVLRTRLRVKGLVPGPVEGGGRPAGYFTSATGITIYLGDAWPTTPYEWAIVGDVGGNLVHRKRLIPDGIGFRAERIDDRAEFVASKDIWFRPVQFVNAPDGTLYVLDMYREVIEHPASLPPVIKRHLDLTSGRDRGRIYRIVPDGYRRRSTPRLSRASSEELVALLAHRNGWHRMTAARLLYERQDRSVVPLLEKMACHGETPEGRIHALWALAGLESLSPSVLLEAMNDSHPQVRRHAARLSESLLSSSAALRAKLASMADDSEPVVYYQVAFSLGEMSGQLRDEALVRLAARAADDPYVRFAIQSSLATGAGNVLARVALDPQLQASRGAQALVRELAAQIGRQRRDEDVAVLLDVVARLGDQPAARAILSALALPPDDPLARRLAAVTGGKSDQLFAAMVREAMQSVMQVDRLAGDRISAVSRLTLGRWDEVRPALAVALQADQPPELQRAAVQALARWDAASVAQMLIELWPQLAPELRQRAGDLLLSRTAWTVMWLEAVADGRIPPGDLAPGHWQALRQHADPQVRQKAEAISGQFLANRQEVIERYRPVLEMRGDAQRGRQVFAKTCAPCHQVAGQGHPIGPNLLAMRNRGKEAILVNVLAPNAEVNPQYINYVVVTKDGRSLSGMIADDSATAVRLVRADNAQDTILRVDIESLRSTGQSLMPEGMERDVDLQAMADLLEFLMTVEAP
ncbi:MAG: cytochrome c [Pirellulaceae bacterium]|nr:MAG: cytochrome c [Pirellulaceae bacterium]